MKFLLSSKHTSIWPVWSPKWWQFMWGNWFTPPPHVCWQVEFYSCGFKKRSNQSVFLTPVKLTSLPRDVFFSKGKFFEIWAFFEPPQIHHSHHTLKIWVDTHYLPEMVRESFVLLGQKSVRVEIGETHTLYELALTLKDEALLREILGHIKLVLEKYPSKN